MTNNVLCIKPVEMTTEVMEDLEARGLITRIVAGAFSEDPGYNNTIDKEIYVSDIASGAHRLCSATANRIYPDDFCVHSDFEEVYFVGPEDAKPLYLVISTLSLEAFNQKAKNETLCDNDIISVEVKFNDPEVSFFAINKGTLHGEFVDPKSEAKAPSFFFSAGNSLTHYFPDLNGYVFDTETYL